MKTKSELEFPPVLKQHDGFVLIDNHENHYQIFADCNSPSCSLAISALNAAELVRRWNLHEAIKAWKARLRGKIYCSPACGRGCTKQEFDEAHKSAREVLVKMKTRGWKIHVWENMGWHWGLSNNLCCLSLWPPHRHGDSFCVMCGDPGHRNCTSGSCAFNTVYHKDPNKAVALMIKEARPRMEIYARGLKDLENIL